MSLIHNRYQILHEIGRGTFGTVYKAEDTEHPYRAYVAIKCDFSDVQMLRHEATMLNYLNQRCSPSQRSNMGIPKVHWYGTMHDEKQGGSSLSYFGNLLGEYGTISMMVMPHYDGGTLTQFVQQQSFQLSTELIHHMMQDMLGILQTIHELYVVHRDLKPDNFLINSHGKMVLIDFGLSTFYLDGDTGKHVPKSSEPAKEIIGSPLYASLNTHLGIRNSRRDDCLQLGYIGLFLGLGGHLPWENISMESPLLAHPRNRERYHAKKSIEISDETWMAYMKRCQSLSYEETPVYQFSSDSDESSED